MDDIAHLTQEIARLEIELNDLKEQLRKTDHSAVNRTHAHDLAIREIEGEIVRITDRINPVVRGYYGLVLLIVSSVVAAVVKLVLGKP